MRSTIRSICRRMTRRSFLLRHRMVSERLIQLIPLVIHLLHIDRPAHPHLAQFIPRANDPQRLADVFREHRFAGRCAPSPGRYTHCVVEPFVEALEQCDCDYDGVYPVVLARAWGQRFDVYVSGLGVSSAPTFGIPHRKFTSRQDGIASRHPSQGVGLYVCRRSQSEL